MPGPSGVPDLGVIGMSVPVLRETRMPAVIVEVGPAPLVVEQGADLARALVVGARGLGRHRLGVSRGTGPRSGQAIRASSTVTTGAGERPR